MQRGPRHLLVFSVFLLLVCVGVGNILFATDWLLPDYFFGEWDPYDNLFGVSPASATTPSRAAVPVLGDYIDDVRFQYSTRNLAGALLHGQDDIVLTWWRWLRGPWRAAVIHPRETEISYVSGVEDVPVCPWVMKDPAVRYFMPMSTPEELLMGEGALFWHNADVMAQLQLRYVAADVHERDVVQQRLKRVLAARDVDRGTSSPALAHSDESKDIARNREKHEEATQSDENEKEEDDGEGDSGEPRRVLVQPTSTAGSAAPLDYKALVRELDKNRTWAHKVRFFDLPRQRAAVAPQYPWTHFYIALNLYKNEVLLPFLTAALVAWLEDEIAPFFDLAHAVTITIYANKGGPQDQTSALIRTLLIPELHRVGVRVVFATTRGRCLEMANKTRGVERIEWMACVRNKAMQPLYERGMRLFQEKAVTADGLVVLFLNDVYFRPQDLTRLLESKVEAGMRSPELLSDGVIAVEEVPQDTPDSTTVTTSSSSSSSASPSSRWPGFDMACGMDFYFNFYDTWVSRDRRGETFRPSMPYTADVATQDAMQRIFDSLRSSPQRDDDALIADLRRQAVPVKCCWNGAAAMRGSFFLPPSAAMQRGGGGGGGGGEDNNRHVTNDDEFEEEEEVILHDQTSARAWLSAYFLRLQLRRVAADRINWGEACAKAASKQRAAVADVDLSATKFLEDDVVTLLDAATRCATPNQRDERFCAAPAFPSSSSSTHTANVSLHRFEPSGRVVCQREPSVRFRHPLVPSFGAMHQGRRRLQHRGDEDLSESDPSVVTSPIGAAVVDNVCLASECQLICHDMQQAALLRHARLPVILMNPTVRVVYEAADLNRVVVSGWYESGWLYRWMRRFYEAERRLAAGLPQPWRARAPRWWRLFFWRSSAPSSAAATTTGAAEPNNNNDDDGDGAGSAVVDRRYSPKVHMRTHVDATDDWLRPDAVAQAREKSPDVLRLAVPRLSSGGDGHAGTVASTRASAATVTVRVNVTRLTRMVCLDPLLTTAYDPPRVLHAVVRLFVLLVVLVLLWLCDHWAACDAAKALTVSPFIAVHLGDANVSADRTRTQAPLLIPSPRFMDGMNVDVQAWLRGRRALVVVRLCVQRQLARCCGRGGAESKASASRRPSPLRSAKMDAASAHDGAVAVRIRTPTSTGAGKSDVARPFPMEASHRAGASSPILRTSATSAAATSRLAARGMSAAALSGESLMRESPAPPATNPFLDMQGRLRH